MAEQDKAQDKPSDKSANDAKSQAAIDDLISDSESEALEGIFHDWQVLRLGGDIVKRGEMTIKACRQRLEVIGDEPERQAERSWIQDRIDQLERKGQ
jgi:hypothetical protein